jgi:hypothetical protein
MAALPNSTTNSYRDAYLFREIERQGSFIALTDEQRDRYGVLREIKLPALGYLG